MTKERDPEAAAPASAAATEAAPSPRGTPTPIALPPAPPAKRDPWQKFYQTHSPVMYSEMVERWGGESALWNAYANMVMERAEAEYFEKSLFNSAKAFANVVIPALRDLDKRVRAIEEFAGVGDSKK